MSNTDAPLEGQLIASQFKILRKLGEGGMGAVYLAEQVDIDRKVVVKVLHPELSALNPIALERFRREAKAVAQLNHPNIVQIFVFGTAENGQMYLAMEYIEGRDLAHDLKRGQVPQPRALRILDQVCSALIEAHGAGIVHRDLKPENIMLADRHGNPDYVKVLDFGIAKLHASNTTGPSLTQAGTVFGTPRYMSPEQVKGESVDARADIYALGVILYEMLTGSHPFEATTSIDYLMKHVGEEVRPPSEAFDGLEIQPRIESIVMKALEKDPAARYQSAAEMQRDVRIALRDFSESARGYPSHEMPQQAGPTRRAGKSGASGAIDTAAITRGGPETARRRGTPAWVWVVIALVLVGGIVGVAVAIGGGRKGEGPIAKNDPTTKVEHPPKDPPKDPDPVDPKGEDPVDPKGPDPKDPPKDPKDPPNDPDDAPAPTTDIAEGTPVDGFPIPRDVTVSAETPQANMYNTKLSAREIVGFYECKLHGKFELKKVPNGLQIEDQDSPFTYITMMPNSGGLMLTLSRNAFYERKAGDAAPKIDDAYGIHFPDGVSLMVKADTAVVMTSEKPFAEVCEYFVSQYGKGDGVFVAKDTKGSQPYCTIANNGSGAKWQAIAIVNNPSQPGTVMISVARKM